MQELIDRLPFPVGFALFATDLVVEGTIFLGIVLGASLALEAYVLTDKVKAILKGIAAFFQWFLEWPGTGEEVNA